MPNNNGSISLIWSSGAPKTLSGPEGNKCVRCGLHVTVVEAMTEFWNQILHEDQGLGHDILEKGKLACMHFSLEATGVYKVLQQKIESHIYIVMH